MIRRLFGRKPDQGGADQDTPAELARVKARLKASRQRVRKQKAQLAKVRARLRQHSEWLRRAHEELAVLRAFTLQLFTDHEIPDAVDKVIDDVRAERITYLDADPLRALVRCVLEVEASGREGAIIEAGTALGGSAIAMAAAKDPARPMRVHDVFGMIPPPTAKDGQDVIERYESIADGRSRGLSEDVYYGYRDDLLGEVTDSFARHGVEVGENSVELVQGLFEDTITGDEPVALAHVDGDWYESTMTCLTRLAPRLVPGGAHRGRRLLHVVRVPGGGRRLRCPAP